MNHSTALLTDRRIEADLWRDGHEVTEERRWDLSELKHLYRSLHAHINEQDVQHSAAVKIGDLKTETSYFSVR